MSNLAALRFGFVVGAAAVAVVCAPAPARAQTQTCATPADCTVVGAACTDGFCRLTAPEPVIASLPLGTIELVEPAARAVAPGAQPDLRFAYPAGAASVAVFITDEPPDYDAAGNLQNTSHIVWYWNSRFEGLVTGVVPYGKGKLLDSRDMTCVDRTPAPLAPGIYYWGALGWGASGPLSHQSELRAFSVGAEKLSGTFCDDVQDCGRAGFAICTDPNHYCALRCASDRDCFAGTACDLSTVGAAAAFPWGVCRAPGPACACDSSRDEHCDDVGPTALGLCYRPDMAGTEGAAGCDCGGSSTTPASNPCYTAMAAALVLVKRPRRRDRGRARRGRDAPVRNR